MNTKFKHWIIYKYNVLQVYRIMFKHFYQYWNYNIIWIREAEIYLNILYPVLKYIWKYLIRNWNIFKNTVSGTEIYLNILYPEMKYIWIYCIRNWNIFEYTVSGTLIYLNILYQVLKCYIIKIGQCIHQWIIRDWMCTISPRQ